MVPIGNVQLAGGEVLLYGGNGFGVVNHPQAVGDQAVGEIIAGGAARGQVVHPAAGSLRLVLIEAVNLAEVAVGGPHQLEAVLLGLAEGFLMGQHHTGGKLLQAHLGDEAPQLFHLSLVHLGEKFHLIKVEARVHVIF